MSARHAAAWAVIGVFILWLVALDAAMLFLAWWSFVVLNGALVGGVLLAWALLELIQ